MKKFTAFILIIALIFSLTPSSMSSFAMAVDAENIQQDTAEDDEMDTATPDDVEEEDKEEIEEAIAGEEAAENEEMEAGVGFAQISGFGEDSGEAPGTDTVSSGDAIDIDDGTTLTYGDETEVIDTDDDGKEDGGIVDKENATYNYEFWKELGATLTIWVVDEEGNLVYYEENDEEGNDFKYHVGDPFYVSIAWNTIPDSVNNPEFDDVPNVRYPLGDFQVESTDWAPLLGVSLTGQTVEVGQWKVVSEEVDPEIDPETGEIIPGTGVLQDVLYVWFNELFHGAQSRKFGVLLEGEIPLDPDYNSSEKGSDVQVGDTIIKVKPEYDNSIVEAKKTMGNLLLNEDGRFISRAKITLTIDGGNVTELKITDILKAPLKLAYPEKSSNLTVVYTPKDPELLEDVTGGVLSPGENKGQYLFETVSDADGQGNAGFKLSFPEMTFHHNDVITIEYDVEVDIEDIAKGNAIKTTGENKVLGSYIDSKNEERNFGNNVLWNLPMIKPKLAKSGGTMKSVDGTDRKVITWTLVFNSGSFGRLHGITDERLNAYFPHGVTFTDILDENLELTEKYQELFTDYHDIKDGENAGKYQFTIRLNDIANWAAENPKTYPGTVKCTMEGDGSYTYEITYDTYCNNDSLEYGNDASVGDNQLPPGMIPPVHATTGVSLSFLKYFRGKVRIAEDDTYAMKWEIRYNIPSTFDYIEITDVPQQISATSYPDKAGYIHRYLKGTLAINGKNYFDNEEAFNAQGVFVKEWDDKAFSDNVPDTFSAANIGFTITIKGKEYKYDDQGNQVYDDDKYYEFAEEWRGGKMGSSGTRNDSSRISVTFETEAVKKDETTGEWTRDGSLTGAYYWRNNAYETIYRDGKEIKREDYHYTSRTDKPDIEKGAVVDDYGTMIWHIKFNEYPLIEWITSEDGTSYLDDAGALFSEAGYSFKLVDELPDNTYFVKDTAYLSLVSLGSKGKSDSINKTTTIGKLTDYLEVSESVVDGKNVVIFEFDSSKGNLADWFKNESPYGEKGTNKSSQFLEIYYEVRIADYDQFVEDKGSSKQVEFTNNIVGPDSNVNEEPVTGTGSVNFIEKGPLTKFWKYDSSMENDPKYNSSPFFKTLDDRINVYFYVDINPQKFTLGQDGMLTIEDVMGSDLELLIKSVELKDIETGDTLVRGAEGANGYTLDYVHNADGTSTMSLTVPDARAYRLSYWCVITADPIDQRQDGMSVFGDLTEAWNTIEVKARQNTKAMMSKFFNSVVKPQAWAYQDYFNFDIFKFTRATGKGMDPLAGAEFELVLGMIQDGEFVEGTYAIGEENIDPRHNVISLGEFTEGSHLAEQPDQAILEALGIGEARYKLSKIDAQIYIYRLTEITAPEGYVRETKPVYFYFNSYGSYLDTDARQAAKEEAEAIGAVPYYLGDSLYFENNPEYGYLTVSKTVVGEGAELDREFTFTITLDDNSVNGEYGDMTFTNGVATITLKHGESKTAIGLFKGIKYTVTESENDGYTVTSKGATGTIPEEGQVMAEFVNTKVQSPSQTPDDPTTPDGQQTSQVPPDTHDNSNLGIWIALMLVAAFGITIAVDSLRKRTRRDNK